MSERIMVRFGATLAANLIRGALSFLSGILIARGLGASGYGDLNFLLGSFAAISQLLEMGTSSAFYTFISRRQRSARFFAFYLVWLAFQFVATVLMVWALLPDNLVGRIWVGHERGIVLLAFGASFLMTQAWGMVSQLGEATRKTVLIQAVATLQAVLHLGLIASAIYWNWLSVHALMWLLVGEYIVLSAVLAPGLIRENLAAQIASAESGRAMVKEFANYCKPLVVYSWVGFLYHFADRWLLQQFGGAEQQGFFAVGQQFANISLIATTSMLKVFWKEIADAREQQDWQRMQQLYASVTRGLYFAAACISCLLIPYSREILGWSVGAEYEGAWFCLALMFLYPIHQTLGQIQGTMFFASGETRDYARLGLIVMGISIPVTYLILAPRSAVVPGLGLAAVGLALKTVLLQIVGVSLQAYVLARDNQWSIDYTYQLTVVTLLLALGWLCKWTGAIILGLVAAMPSASSVMFAGSVLYLGLCLVFLFCLPSLAGLSRDQFRNMVLALRNGARPAVA